MFSTFTFSHLVDAFIQSDVQRREVCTPARNTPDVGLSYVHLMCFKCTQAAFCCSPQECLHVVAFLPSCPHWGTCSGPIGQMCTCPLRTFQSLLLTLHACEKMNIFGWFDCKSTAFLTCCISPSKRCTIWGENGLLPVLLWTGHAP